MEKLTIILLNWHCASQTLACLHKLGEWKTPPDIYLVNNGDTQDGNRRLLSLPKKCTLLQPEENLGFAGGNNLAIKKALGETTPSTGAQYLLLLNPDASIDECDAIGLLTHMQANPSSAIIGPVIAEKSGNETRHFAGGRSLAHHRQTRIELDQVPRDPNAPLIDAEYVSGTVALLRVEVLKTIGIFDETYFFSGEMADLCKRATVNGFEIGIHPAAIATHDTDLGPSKLRATLHLYYNLRNRFLFIRNHHNSQRTWLSTRWTFVCLAEAVKQLAKAKPASARAALLAMVDGLSGRFGNRHDRFNSR